VKPDSSLFYKNMLFCNLKSYKTVPFHIQKLGNKSNNNMSDTLPRSRRNIICDAMLSYLPFIVQLFKSQNCCYIWKLENMDDDGGCYVELYFYDKLSSLRPSDMSNSSVKHVWGIRFGSIRCETCMILHDNLLPHLRLNSANNPIVSNADQRNIIPGRDAALPDVPPNELAKRHATTTWQVLVGWKETSDWWIVTFTTFPTHC
jgi:hypothetical protein